MSEVNLYLHNQIAAMRRADDRHRAKIWRLLRQGGSSEGDWLSRRGRWLLCQLGHWMVQLGQQLQRAGTYNHDLSRP